MSFIIKIYDYNDILFRIQYKQYCFHFRILAIKKNHFHLYINKTVIVLFLIKKILRTMDLNYINMRYRISMVNKCIAKILLFI